MRLSVFIAISAIAMPVARPCAAAAATSSATMQVGAVVEPSCSLDLAPLVFDGATSARPQVDAQAAIALGCTPNTSFTVSIDEGQSPANGRRRMAGTAGDAFLAYEIFQDPARTRRWGVGGAGAISGIVPASGRVELSAYGRITADVAVAERYADTVTVLIAF